MAKSKYESHVLPKFVLIEGWARDGLTEEQIAHNLGISKSTLAEYKLKYPDFLEVLKRGKEVADYEVENALFKRAIGYRYDEVTKERGIDLVTGKMGLGVTKVVTKEVAPDVTAQIYWLKNRKRAQWRDRPPEEEPDDSDTGVVMMPSIMEKPQPPEYIEAQVMDDG